MSQGFSVGKGCLAVFFGMFAWALARPLTYLTIILGIIIWAGMQQGSNQSPTPPPSVPSVPSAPSVPFVPSIPVTLSEHVITTETSLLRLPAGSPFQILTEHADGTVTISSGGTEWTVPRSILP